jgi:hypothetical protein
MRWKMKLATVVTAVLLISPVVVASWLSRKDHGYDETIGVYECDFPRTCIGDFNKDRIPEQVVVVDDSGSISQKQSLLVIEGRRELLRLPYVYLDNTLRTHVGIRVNSDRTTLVIYHPGSRGTTTQSVYSWSAGKMVQVPPSSTDQELLAAMAARDESGNFNQWVLFRILKIPGLVLYYLLFLSVIAFKNRRFLLRLNHALK